MRPDAVGMTEDDASQLWAMLGAEGKAPPELGYASHVLPSYSVAIEPWLDRLASRFLRQLCRKNAHFKLVLAPYGGGKTHFLLALGARALAENFAVAYVPCGESISLDSPLDIHREVIKKLQLPEQANPGLRALIERVAQTKRQEIRDHGAPDVDKAFQRWTDSIQKDGLPRERFWACDGGGASWCRRSVAHRRSCCEVAAGRHGNTDPGRDERAAARESTVAQQEGVRQEPPFLVRQVPGGSRGTWSRAA